MVFSAHNQAPTADGFERTPTSEQLSAPHTHAHMEHSLDRHESSKRDGRNTITFIVTLKCLSNTGAGEWEGLQWKHCNTLALQAMTSIFKLLYPNVHLAPFGTHLYHIKSFTLIVCT